MQYAALGAARVEVSRLCLGTMNLGSRATPEESHAILDTALEAGINYVDTANTYGSPGRPGIAESIIGDWFARGGDRRERTVLATKLFEPTADWPNHGGLSALNIRRACDASLLRLQTDHIDVLQMHHIDRAARWDEIWEAFDVLRRQGKIIYAGSSNFAGWNLAVAQGAARDRGNLGLVSEQSVYNLAQRTVELEVLPAAEHLGIGVVAWSPLAGGLLAGTPTGHQGRRTDPGETVRRDQHRGQIDATADIAGDLGTTTAQLALAWLLTRPAVVAPVVGPRTVEQLCGLLPAIDLVLSSDVLAALDRVWPGPGGQAPEAYAW
ncbi:aldo/keto reductase [Actinotalea sp. K2]|uniref:aldo/keto reductase n=1 Tax=Actinotalea sp. K2 TaxID=2939438 RepID=UPI0020177759|nr:aldo/keto reductase [Actinotalea sp. K2]MCL3861208.1 aldo/keto reductase [Actinotalea sp. K2]